MDIDGLDSKLVLEASKVLGLGEYASIDDIKKKYRELMKRWHPDSCKDDIAKCKERAAEIAHAYEVVMVYCEHYRYSFNEKDITDNLPMGAKLREKWEKQFGNDPMWS